MRKKKKTIILAKIRKHIRRACDWRRMDDGMPTFWSSLNYQRTRRMRGKTLAKKERDYYYYTRSSRAIEDIAVKIYELMKDEKE